MPARQETGLPHYNNSQASINQWEPVYLNQFEVIITPPLAVARDTVDLLPEQIKEISGLPEVTPTGVVEQQYLWAKRSFSNPIPDNIVADLEIKFEVNLNDSNSMYVYDILRSWAELHFDPSTGKFGTKREYSGEITVLITNKRRQVFRQFNFKPVFMNTPLTPMSLAYLSDEIYVLTAHFRSDAWKEKRLKSHVERNRNA